MKRKLLPLLIAGLTAASANVALAGAPTVYGKVNLTVHKNDFEALNTTTGVGATDIDNWSMESNASRIGIKGDYDISADLKVVYKAEYEAYFDDGDNSDNAGNGDEFGARNIYAGLQGGWGTLIAGRNDSPLKLAQGEVDRFNDLPVADIQNIMVGENRADNMIMYSTPNFSGFGFTLGLVQGEDSGLNQANDDDGLADWVSAAATYMNSMFYAAIAYDSNARESTDTLRLVGEVNVGPAKIGAIYQTSEGNEDGDAISSVNNRITPYGTNFDEQDAWVLNGEVKLGGPWKLKAQYGVSESTAATAGLEDAEATLTALGVDYKLNDFAKLFAYYAALETEGQTTTIANPDATEDKTFAVGFDFKF